MKTKIHLPSAPLRTFETYSPEQTFSLGKTMGYLLNPGLTLFLVGDLGSGKTVLAQGLARGLGVPSDIAVTSPTYTLINIYPGRIRFCHVDLYRLSTPVDPDEIGLGELFDGDGEGVVAVEWPQRLHPSDYPPVRLELNFAATGEAGRRIEVIPYGLAAADLLKNVPVSFFS